MNPQHDEHLRDSAPDNSRFDGFDRGDLGREDAREIDLSGLEARVAPRQHGKLVAMSLLASIGLFARNAFNPPKLPLGFSSFAGQRTTSKLRRAQRKLCRELGKRQYRRQTLRSYSLRDSQAVGA